MHSSGIENLRNLKQNIANLSKENLKDSKTKLSSKDRLSMFFDNDSFVELDAFFRNLNSDVDYTANTDIKDMGAGVICGYGKVDGRLVFAFSQDFSTGSAITKAHAIKITRLIDNAIKMKAPVVGFYDSIGAKISESLGVLSSYGMIIKKMSEAKGKIPQISAVMGACYGANSLLAGLADFRLANQESSEMFIVGANLINTGTNLEITTKELGGSDELEKNSDNIHLSFETEAHLVGGARELVSYLPNNSLEMPPIQATADAVVVDNLLNDFASANLKADSYDVRYIISELSDDKSYFELSKGYAEAITTGFIRLNGMVVGVLANNGRNIGQPTIDTRSARKMIDFVNMLDMFNIPLLSLVDIEEFKTESVQQAQDMMSMSARLAFTFASFTAPFVSVVTRSAYGSAYLSMGSKNSGADVVFAWPDAVITELAPSAAAQIMFEDELNKADDVRAKRTEIISEYEQKIASPFNAAARGLVDDVIEPSHTRHRLIDVFDMLMTKDSSFKASSEFLGM